MTNADDVLKRFDEIAAQWEKEDPGATDVETPPTGAGLDLSAGGADSPEGQLKDAFERAGKAPSEEAPEPVSPEGVHGNENVAPPQVEASDARNAEPTEPWANLAHRLKQSESPAAPAVDPLLEKMRAVGWAPKEKPKADWGKLQADLANAEHGADTMKNVGAMLHAAAPGFEAPAGAGQGAVNAAKAALKLPREQQVVENSQAGEARAEQALAEKAKTDAEHKAKTEADLTAENASLEQERAIAAKDPRLMKLGITPDAVSKLDRKGLAELNTRLSALPAAAAQAAKEKSDEEKKVDAETLRTVDTESLGAAKQLWLKTSPYAKEHALTPGDLADIKSRKDWEDFLKDIKPSGKAKAAGGGPAKEYKTLDDISDRGMRAMVSSAMAGYPIPSGIDRKTKTRVLELVSQLKDDYDPTAGERYAKVAAELAGDPKIQNAVNGKKHFTRALENMPATFDQQSVNRVANAIQHGSGGAGLSQYESDIAVGAGEMAKGLAENDQHGKDALKKLLDPEQSPEQMRKHLQELIFLQDENLDTRLEQFHAVAPKGAKVPGLLANFEAEKNAKAAGPAKPATNPDEMVSLQSRDGKRKKTMKRAAAEAIVAAPGGDAYEVK
jgi:hypothetical protein